MLDSLLAFGKGIVLVVVAMTTWLPVVVMLALTGWLGIQGANKRPAAPNAPAQVVPV